QSSRKNVLSVESRNLCEFEESLKNLFGVIVVHRITFDELHASTNDRHAFASSRIVLKDYGSERNLVEHVFENHKCRNVHAFTSRVSFLSISHAIYQKSLP